jgi:hypothetical protein
VFPETTSPSKRAQLDGIKASSPTMKASEKTGEVRLFCAKDDKKSSSERHMTLRTRVSVVKTMEIIEGNSFIPTRGDQKPSGMPAVILKPECIRKR